MLSVISSSFFVLYLCSLGHEIFLTLWLTLFHLQFTLLQKVIPFSLKILYSKKIAYYLKNTVSEGKKNESNIILFVIKKYDIFFFLVRISK